MSGPNYRTWIEVSLGRIAGNFRQVRELVGPEVEVAAVVKADAYRHGAVEVSRTLEKLGARWLAVSSVEEGVTLRQAGITARILVMAGVLPCEREALFDCSLTPVVHTLADIDAVDRLASARGVRIAYHLKIDSGLGRLGTREVAEEIGATITRAAHADLEGVMTHLASAADWTSSQTDEQERYFDALCGRMREIGIRPAYAHMAATIPVAYGRRSAWKNMVRPGHAIYGYVSPLRLPADAAAPPNLLELKPALNWRARIVSVKEIPAGARVGYGGSFEASSPMRIGIVGVGYADGFPHRLSNRGSVIAGGNRVPILGAVSMDVTTIDLTRTPTIGPGDAVTLLGEEGDASLNAQEIARSAGTISYSVLCGIGARVRRIYVD